MTNVIQPFHFLVIALAGWLNRQQQADIDHLMEESRVFKEQQEGQRIRFTDEQRIRLAINAKMLGCRLLHEFETVATPASFQSHTGIQQLSPILAAIELSKQLTF